MWRRSLPRRAGATVIGTTSRNQEFLRSLGSDTVIDYRSESGAQDGGVDVVLDTVGGETQERSWALLEPGGILVSVIQQPSADTAAQHGVRAAMVYSSPPVGKTLTEAAALVEAGKLRPEVSQVLPLSEIRKAHEMVEGRHTRGKVVLQVA